MEQNSGKKTYTYMLAFGGFLLFLLFVFQTIIRSTISFIVGIEYGFYIGYREALLKPTFFSLGYILLSLIIYIFLYFNINDIKIYFLSKKIIKKILIFIIGLNTILVCMFYFFTFEGHTGKIYISDEDLSRTAIHEAGHALINELQYPGTTIAITVFTGEDYSRASRYLGNNSLRLMPAGLYQSYPEFNEKTEDYYNEIRTLLAGMLAEELFTKEKEAYVGASSDLEMIHELVVEMVENGLVHQVLTPWEIIPLEDKTKIYNEIVDPLYQETREILLEYENEIIEIRDLLLAKKRLNYEDIEKIIWN